MTKEQLQWAMYEAYATQLLNRIEAQEAEIATLRKQADGALCVGETLAKERDGLLTQVQDMRAERERLRSENQIMRNDAEDGYAEAIKVLGDPIALSKERDALRAEVAALQERLRASIARGDFAQMEVAALMSQTPKHPVKVGEWVTDGHKARQVRKVFADWYLLRTGHDWKFDRCTPCDPPASDHDTPEGKDVAESVIRDSRKTGPADEIKVGDVVEVFQATGDITATSDIGLRGTVLEIASEDKSVRLKNLTQNKEEWVDMCDVRKVTT